MISIIILLHLYLFLDGWIRATHALSSPSVSTSGGLPRILSVGLAAVDFVAQVPHFPSPDEKMRSTVLTIEGGGNAANTACAIGRLGLCESHIVTGIGTDANGPTILQGLQECHVNTEKVAQFDGSSPFTYILVTAQDQSRTCIHQPAAGDIPTDFAKSLSITQEDFAAVHFDVRYPQLAVALAKQCAKAEIPYSVDVERPREGLLEILEHAEVVICNADYCQTILRELDPEEQMLLPPEVALRKVISQQAPNAKIAIQTLGGKGSCLIRMDQDIPNGNVVTEDASGNPNHAPSVIARDNALFCGVFGNTQIVDTTGAGDSFQGTYEHDGTRFLAPSIVTL
jgi:sugar/nucleoside kinase (ribokinase family)